MTNDICELGMDQLEIVSGGALSGISYLVAVSQMKANNANDDALAGALAGAMGGAGAKGKARRTA